MPTSFNTDGKPAYVYNQADDTWYQVAGKTDLSGTFEWAGLHTFLSSVVTEDHFTAKDGVNNFLNPAARDSAITSPIAGTVCLIRQNGGGTTVNEIQYYDGTTWRTLIPSQTGNQGKVLQTDGIITTWQNTSDAVVTNLMLMGG
jgi:hypothetical protein